MDEWPPGRHSSGKSPEVIFTVLPGGKFDNAGGYKISSDYTVLGHLLLMLYLV